MAVDARVKKKAVHYYAFWCVGGIWRPIRNGANYRLVEGSELVRDFQCPHLINSFTRGRILLEQTVKLTNPSAVTIRFRQPDTGCGAFAIHEWHDT